MSLRSRRLGWIYRLARLWFVSSLFIASITPSWALAQSKDNLWADPLNLSHSGIATNPAIVTDSNGVVHAVWQDDLANYVYTRFDGNQWSPLETTDLDRLFRLPITREATSQTQSVVYNGPNPLFIAGPNQDIVAFWISAQGRLFTSTVKSINFESLAAWDTGRIITPDVTSFAVAVDSRGELHLAYLRIVDEPLHPVGIYYTRSKNSGRNWAVPKLLYESPYLRTLDEGEANLGVATAGAEDALHVYVAWDNRPRKQVLLAQSADSGDNWEQAAMIAGPAPGSGSAGPFNIQVGANQKSVVLVWQSGRPGGACSQLYQSSRDAGATWSDPEPMIEGLSGCAQSNQFLTGSTNSPTNPLYFLTEIQDQIYLSAWNGLQWSEPEEQPVLASFEDPEIFTQIDYSCHQASLLEKRLYVIGCDQGEGGDVWVTSRDLEADTSWFKPRVWSQLSPVTIDNFEMKTVDLVATEDGSIHAFFSQPRDPAIYYGYWDGGVWSRITPVLELPEGEAASPVIAAGPGNELFVISRSNRGTLYVSRATSETAVMPSSWSTPTPIGISQNGEIGSVDLALDVAGTLYVAYSIPVNEERGIYLVSSKDQGTTWSEPLRVFDGAAAGFDLVGAPSLVTSMNGLLHLVWSEQSIQGDGAQQPIALYYARSEDGGHTFNEAEAIIDEPVAWREVMIDGKGQLHLLWQSPNTLTTVWDQVSLDDGHTWQYPQGLPNQGRLAAVTTDPAGRLHLVGVGPDALDHWLWDGSRWQSEDPLRWPLASERESTLELLAVAVNKEGKMIVVSGEPMDEGGVAERSLLFSTRTLDLPTKQMVIQEAATQTLLPPTLAPATPTFDLLLTPTASVVNQSANQEQTESVETNGSISPFTMALLPVALLLLSVLGIVIRQVARIKDR